MVEIESDGVRSEVAHAFAMARAFRSVVERVRATKGPIPCLPRLGGLRLVANATDVCYAYLMARGARARSVYATAADVSSIEVRAALIAFVRDFGLLSRDRTPCGKDLPISHAHALMYLFTVSEPISQRALCSQLGIDKSNVARLCSKLEQDGHLVQAAAPDDGRAVRLSLTTKGRVLALQLERSSRARFDRVLSELPTLAHRRILDALRELTAAVQRVNNSNDPEEKS